jgi:hypothetical protein
LDSWRPQRQYFPVLRIAHGEAATRDRRDLAPAGVEATTGDVATRRK